MKIPEKVRKLLKRLRFGVSDNSLKPDLKQDIGRGDKFQDRLYPLQGLSCADNKTFPRWCIFTILLLVDYYFSYSTFFCLLRRHNSYDRYLPQPIDSEVFNLRETRWKEFHRFWLRLRHAVILISNVRTSTSRKMNLMALT